MFYYTLIWGSRFTTSWLWSKPHRDSMAGILLRSHEGCILCVVSSFWCSHQCSSSGDGSPICPLFLREVSGGERYLSLSLYMGICFLLPTTSINPASKFSINLSLRRQNCLLFQLVFLLLLLFTFLIMCDSVHLIISVSVKVDFGI